MIFRNNLLKVLGISKTFLVDSVVLCLISLLQDEYPGLCITKQFVYELSYCYCIYIWLGF